MTKNPVKKKKAAKAAAKPLAKSTTPKKPTPTTDGRLLDKLDDVAKAVAADAAPVPPTEIQERYRACVAEVNAVLKKHRCRIMPAISEVEPVGGEPTNKILVSATWGIMPEA